MRKFNCLLSFLMILCILCSVFSMPVYAATTSTFNLELTVPAAHSDVTVALYSGKYAYYSAQGTLQTEASKTTAANGDVTYTYTGVPVGSFHYITSGTGYITLKKNMYFASAVAGTTQAVTAEAVKKITSDDGVHEDGYQPGEIFEMNDIVDTVMAVPDNTIAQNAYNNIVSNAPYFKNYAADPARKHQQTTQSEMEAFLADLDSKTNNMYYFEEIGTSYNKADYQIPFVIFTTTTIPSGSSVEEAAELVNANGKPTVLYQAQIHSDEPAAGEGALAMIYSLAGDYGTEILDDINVCVIPRLSPYTAYTFDREVPSAKGNLDPNGDALRMITNEMTASHEIYYLFWPEIVIDGHEYYFDGRIKSSSGAMYDIEYGLGSSLNVSPDTREISVNTMLAVKDGLANAGFRANVYDTTSPKKYTSVANNVGRPFYGALGSISFLFESPGGGAGLDRSTGLNWFDRRVTGHYIAVKSVFDYAAQNADTLKSTIAAGRAKIVSDGAKYNADDVYVLEHSSTNVAGTGISFPNATINYETGKVTTSSTTLYSHDTAARSRVRPTAYVISKGESWASSAVSTFNKLNIEYYELPADSNVFLQQYSGTAEEATLSTEKLVNFSSGAYVIPMNQVSGNIIASLMEPDSTDISKNGSFLQQKLYSANDGVLPVYRYIRDLNTEDTTYGGVELVIPIDAPTGLSAVNYPNDLSKGYITGLDATKSYEYRKDGVETYTAVAAGATQIANLAAGTYQVRFAQTATTPISHDCVLTIRDLSIPPVLEFHKSSLFPSAPHAFAGSKVLLKAVEDGIYYRNGVKLENADIDTTIKAGAVALPVEAGNNSYYVTVNGLKSNVISVYGSTITTASCTNMFNSSSSLGKKWTAATNDGTIANLFDSTHTDVRYSIGSVYSAWNTNMLSKDMAFSKLDFFINGAPSNENGTTIAKIYTSSTSKTVSLVVNKDRTLSVVSTGNVGTVNTGITLEANKWYTLETVFDITGDGERKNTASFYLNKALIAKNIGTGYKVTKPATDSIGIYSPAADTNLYYSNATSFVIPSTYNPGYSSSYTHTYKPAITATAGDTANTIKVTATGVTGLEDCKARIFVNGTMTGDTVAIDGTETAITVYGDSNLTDAEVYAAFVDGDGNIINGLYSPLQTAVLTMDVAVSEEENLPVVSGAIEEGKITVARANMIETLKSEAIAVIEIKADDSIVIHPVASNEAVKEIAISTNSKKVFVWCFDSLYPLCDVITQ